MDSLLLAAPGGLGRREGTAETAIAVRASHRHPASLQSLMLFPASSSAYSVDAGLTQG